MKSSAKNKSMKLTPNDKQYQELVKDVGVLLEEARKKAYYEVNQVLVRTYWKIGQRIVESEQQGKVRAEYGSRLLDALSHDLTQKYGRGFSRDNIERMRKFYSLFKNPATLSRKLSWSHFCLILRLNDELARNFYIIESEKENWSVRELDRQINSLLFERISLSKDKKGVLQLAYQGQVITAAGDLIKDPYILEFLGLENSERYTESLLEDKIISHLKAFLLELGKGFMFVGRQQRITIEDEHFYADLVFYNRILRCFVLIELKLGKLTHQDLGQLQMYVNYYNYQVKQQDENPTVGILLCADKKQAIVKYTLPEDNKHIFTARYKLYLPRREEFEAQVKNILNKEETSLS